MLQNARVIAFTVPQLLKGKLTRVGGEGRIKLSHPLPRKHIYFSFRVRLFSILHTVPVAFANNISKANYQKGIVIYIFSDQLWADF